MIRLALFFLTALLPVAAWAQVVTVRSGEHGDFTRLVLSVPEGTGWVLDPDPDRNVIGLNLQGGPFQFDTESVFNRIGTERILSLSTDADGRRLNVQLGCQCAANAFVLHGTMLVVDISPSDEPLQRVAGAMPTFNPQPAFAPKPFARELSQLRFDDRPRIGPEAVRSIDLPYLPQRLDRDPAGAPGKELAEVSKDLGRQIAADLAIAATQGLLDPAVRSVDDPDPVTLRPDPDHVAGTDPKAPDTLNPAIRLAAGLSGIDHKDLQKGRISVGGEVCIDEAMLAIESWSEEDDDPSVVLAKRRGDVFREFDRISPEALQSYGKALIYYGFGAEARSVLKLQPDMELPVLIALSFLVDGNEDPAQLFSGMSHCDSPAALWSVLARSPDPAAPKIAEAAILRGFESLPRHLRSHLGPQLVEHLAEAGYPHTAQDVLRRLQRMEGHETDSIALGKAQLALRGGDPADAGKRLHDLSVSGGPEAAKAVAAAIDLAEATDAPVPERIVELTDAFATELRNSEDGPKLWQAHVRSLLINGHFDAAFDEMKAEHGMPADVLKATQQSALRTLVDKADDILFLKHATLALSQGVHPEQKQLGTAIAERFIDLGLAEAAMLQLDTLAGAGEDPGVRLARARALLSLGRPEEAEIILIGQRGDEVARLRAEARKQMGDHVFARNIFEEVGENREAVEAAWLSGEWKDLSEGDSAFAPAAALMDAEPVDVDPANVSLAGVDAVFSASTRSRETLRALLDATAIPNDP
ncbi:hypothetical protein [Mameliella sediminis]|uniref:hypothetical protein n=1 Tax=Mameliella sediminis TaxID=2836866 RepID=UPI001C4621B1|nr:hypothetical protein [Mameliella sediminis]MBV7395336.1 hypothetical protein [Mameliella sediminis]